MSALRIMAEGVTKYKTVVKTSKETPDKVHILVDPDTNDPTKAWQRIRKELKVKSKVPTDRHTPVAEDKVRFVCLSDTHGRVEEREEFVIPDGDVLLHAGDFTMSGDASEICAFSKFLGKLPHKHKLVIAGNRDMCLDDDKVAHVEKRYDHLMKKYKVPHPKELLTNCVYLLDEQVEVAGIKIYGAPWQPLYGTWGFQLNRGWQLLKKWNLIPDDVDILMTHGPPLGIGDKSSGGKHGGCVDLLNTVLHRVKPKFHVFGHIHEGYGMYTDGTTTFVNASAVDRYRPRNPPIVFDIDLPPGKSKDDPLVFPTDSS